jgi:hypothetical protein
MTTTTTPLMNLVLPVVSSELGPLWAQEIIEAFNLIDAHDHTEGNGKQIPLSAVNINDDIDAQANSIINLNSLILNSISSPAPTNSTIYLSGGELYFKNENGVDLQITMNGALNGVTGSHGIGGDYGNPGCTAIVNYFVANPGYQFQSNGTVYAPLYSGSVNIYEQVAGGHKAKLKVPAALGADYDLTLPIALPAATLPVSISATGVMSIAQIATAQIADLAVTSAKIAATTIGADKIVAKSITNAQITDATVITALIADGNVTQAKRSALPWAQFTIPASIFNSGSGAQTRTLAGSVSVASIGRPILVSIYIEKAMASGGALNIQLLRNGGLVQTFSAAYCVGLNTTRHCSGFQVCWFDTPGAGTWTYTLNHVKTTNGVDDDYNSIGYSYNNDGSPGAGASAGILTVAEL